MKEAITREARRLRDLREERALHRGELMGPAQYQVTLTQIALLGRMALQLDLERFLLTLERAETLGPIVDPTLYRKLIYDSKASADLAAAKELAIALQAVKAAAEKLVDVMAEGA